jgi:hypothetical protein
VTATWISWSPVKRGSFRRRLGSCPRPVDVSFYPSIAEYILTFQGQRRTMSWSSCGLSRVSLCHDVVVRRRQARQRERSLLFLGVHRPLKSGVWPKFADSCTLKPSEREKFSPARSRHYFLLNSKTRCKLCYFVINRINSVHDCTSISRLMWPQCSR